MATSLDTSLDYSRVVSKDLISQVLWLQSSSDSSKSAARTRDADRMLPSSRSLLELRGLGREIWADENPDEYVRRLREEW